MTSVENLEFTEAFKNPLCAYVFVVYVERREKKHLTVSVSWVFESRLSEDSHSVS